MPDRLGMIGGSIGPSETSAPQKRHRLAHRNPLQHAIAVMDPPPVAFDHEYHLGDGEGFTFIHFLRHYLLTPETLNSVGRFIKTF